MYGMGYGGGCCCVPVCCPPRYGVAIISIAVLILIALAVIF